MDARNDYFTTDTQMNTTIAKRHYQDLALQAHTEVFNAELARALNHLSLALLYPKDAERDLRTAMSHILNAERSLKEIA
jgi:hypothetical protein